MVGVQRHDEEEEMRRVNGRKDERMGDDKKSRQHTGAFIMPLLGYGE